MKVLLTGSSGQLGREIIHLKPSGINLVKANRFCLDLSNPESCQSYIKRIKPDWIINCGAYTNVEQAESEKELAYLINSLSVKYLAESIKNINSKFIQISTDYVFNGNQNSPYLPEDLKSPINVYGKTKSIGEDFINKIFKNNNKAIIIRTSWLMGPTGQNFALKMLDLLSSKEKVNVIDDQIGSPTSTNTLAKACWQTINLNTKGKSLPPILHIANEGEASWFDIAIEIKKIAKDIGLIQKPVTINPISSSNYPTKAKRPKYSVLDCKSSLQSISQKNNHWKSALKLLFLEYKRNISK
tara:strand:+ start:1602 stop:2498 length:897 start_codon:yes stop_codon:yes gene_type:complete